MSNQPKSKPQITRAEVEKYLSANGIDLKKEKMALVGVRGYYLDTMGNRAVNDVGIWDDCLIWIDETDMASFNGNVDPSRYRKNVASLKVGTWRYKPGNHGSKAYGSYPAFRQADKVTVLRYVDGRAWKADTGLFGINIHHGSKGATNGTSSLGCQTIPFEQWQAFKAYGDMLLKQWGKKDFAYILSDTIQGKTVVNPQPETPKRHNINAAGLELIKSFEGYYSKSYKDPVGIPTIGWGTIQYPDGKKVKMGDTCTKEEAENYLLHEISEKEKGVRDGCSFPITPNQFSACVSFAYNLGVGAFKGSTLLKKLNKGDIAGAAEEFLRWNKAGGKVLKGLTRRREAEKKLFLA